MYSIIDGAPPFREGGVTCYIACQVPMHPRNRTPPYTILPLSIIDTDNNMCPHKHVPACVCLPQTDTP